MKNTNDAPLQMMAVFSFKKNGETTEPFRNSHPVNESSEAIPGKGGRGPSSMAFIAVVRHSWNFCWQNLES